MPADRFTAHQLLGEKAANLEVEVERLSAALRAAEVAAGSVTLQLRGLDGVLRVVTVPGGSHVRIESPGGVRCVWYDSAGKLKAGTPEEVPQA